mgnify:CR=1 FL=1
MINLKGIYNGYSNLAKASVKLSRENIEREATRRLNTCHLCPFKEKRFGVYVCGACGCPLAAKARQNDDVCSNWIK